jgi:hypothetical protein
MMRAMQIAAILVLPLMASCATVQPPTPPAPPQTVVPTAPVAAAPPSSAPAVLQSPAASSIPPQAAATSAMPAPPAAAAPAAGPNIAKAAPTIPPAKVPAPTAQTPKIESITPDMAKPKVPPLDLASLEQRLKSTNAIGVLTKLTLKNQVDDLLDQFRAYYQGKLKTTLADLRRSYDLLVQKVLSLLQDSDPPLATAIVASRDAIWGILSDPKKFATI